MKDMIIETIDVSSPPTRKIVIGQKGEDLFRQIIVDVSAWKEVYPDGNTAIVYSRPDGETYLVTADDHNDKVIWKPTIIDTFVVGDGSIEVRYTAGASRGKSIVMPVTVRASLGNYGDVPDDQLDDWIARIVDAAHGRSAYELAVEHGYTGTEEQWLDAVSNCSVRYDIAQDSLTAQQKLQARNNINAASVDTVENVVDTFNQITGNQAVVFRKGYYATPSTDFDGAVVSFYESYSYDCAISECSPGDVFYCNLAGPPGVTRGYFFVDENNVVITRAQANTTINGAIHAPDGAAYVMFNNQSSRMPSGFYAYKDDSIRSVVDSVKSIADVVYDATFMEVKWSNGGLSGSTGYETVNAKRIRSAYIPIDAFNKVASDGSALFLMFGYDVKRQFVNNNGEWVSQFDSVPSSLSSAAYVRILSKLTSDADFTADDTAAYGIKALASKADYRNPYTDLPDYDLISEYFDDNGVLSSNVSVRFGAWSGGGHKILRVRAKYTPSESGEVPTVLISARSISGHTVYGGYEYRFASQTESVYQSWRIPGGYGVLEYRLQIFVPDGATVQIDSLEIFDDTGVRTMTGGTVYHAHMGFDALYPPGSYDAIVAAAELGFQSCIVIPKFTSDGVPVVFHDDSTISGQITQMDGTAIPTEYDLPISQLTYGQLMQWSIGYSKDPVYAGAKILKMDDFLSICAKTGMRPIFSIHPVLTVEQWQIIKGMLGKYGLTSQMSVKSGNYNDVWKRVINVFGDGNIYSIIHLYSATSTYDILNWRSTGIAEAGIEKTRVDCEFFLKTLEGENGDSYTAVQNAQLDAVIAAGITCSGVLYPNSSGYQIKKYIDKGVTEFTNGRHCSLGLNW